MRPARGWHLEGRSRGGQLARLAKEPVPVNPVRVARPLSWEVEDGLAEQGTFTGLQGPALDPSQVNADRVSLKVAGRAAGVAGVRVQLALLAGSVVPPAMPV